MQPAEKGRHCQSCCKTVVDFTEMSDAEIIRHLSQAGPHVCGRLMPDQLNRALMPAPVQKNGRSGWAWVLAAARDSSFVTTGEVERIGEVQPVIRKERDSSAIEGRLAARFVPDTDRVEIKAGSIRPPADTLPAPTSATRSEEMTAFDGGIVVEKKIDSAIDVLTDTAKQLVSDTLAALGWRPAPALNIYPNPVSRGGAMQLAWKAQPGQYQLALMSTSGQLIAERMLDVGGAGQVDSWKIPASLAAGIYILQVARAAVCTREIMVR